MQLLNDTYARPAIHCLDACISHSPSQENGAQQGQKDLCSSEFS